MKLGLPHAKSMRPTVLRPIRRQPSDPVAWGMAPGSKPGLVVFDFELSVLPRTPSERREFRPKGYTVDELPIDARDYRELAADIVSAYVSHNALSYTDLPKLLAETHNQLRALATPQVVTPSKSPTPAIPVGRSIRPDAIVCLYCGKPFKSLKRHIGAYHQVSADEYRRAFSLPFDYPMVSSAYSAARSELALKIGLGRRRATTKSKK
jgi:predicted transcriptional regulator